MIEINSLPLSERFSVWVDCLVSEWVVNRLCSILIAVFVDPFFEFFGCLTFHSYVNYGLTALTLGGV